MTASDQARTLAAIAARAADDKLATNVVVLDVSEQLVLTEAFVIASAGNERQVNAIVEEVEDQLREAGVKPTRREGAREGRWALLDFLDIVVHVFHEEEREYYALEKLWKDCPRIEVEGLGEHSTEDSDGADGDREGA
ncbi:ribosome silencing factor [Tsukamurella sp. USMM236]|uniref:ribosome silencing factor n=1 Tax=Tsukamurella sp. USMM236 TaxID=3081301 RepID=UPI0030188897